MTIYPIHEADGRYFFNAPLNITLSPRDQRIHPSNQLLAADIHIYSLPYEDPSDKKEENTHIDLIREQTSLTKKKQNGLPPHLPHLLPMRHRPEPVPLQGCRADARYAIP